MKKVLIILVFFILHNSCVNSKKDISVSGTLKKEEQINNLELEGTPFEFKNSVCSRELIGSDIIRVLSLYKFISKDGNQYPYINRLNDDGYLEVHAQKGNNIYFGNMKTSSNGKFVYFNAYTQNWHSKRYNKTNVKMKFTPIQIPNTPFQIEIVIEQNDKIAIRQKLFISSEIKKKDLITYNNQNAKNIFADKEDLLKYLSGKTFIHREGAYVSFTLDKGNYSGIRDLKWLSCKNIEGKWLLELESLSEDCPECKYTYWLSNDGTTITTSDGYLDYELEETH